MSGAATTSVLFTSHELELLIEAITNLAIEMEKAIRAQHDDIIHNVFGEFQVSK